MLYGLRTFRAALHTRVGIMSVLAFVVLAEALNIVLVAESARSFLTAPVPDMQAQEQPQGLAPHAGGSSSSAVE
ncbi:MAG: hypothetical protein PHW10_05195 [Candidatus Peribacteraceae bacterium]|nr:hypothetical protein [Candidatus Peribacteraceae bacterium]